MTAQFLYEKCVKPDPNNNQCIFNYEELMGKQNKDTKIDTRIISTLLETQ